MEQKSAFVDFYEVLGVWPTADDKAIKKAYFNLAKLHHPDVVTETTTNNTGVDFKMINEAFAILSDPIKRRKFDEQLKKKTGGSAEERNESDKRSAQLAFEQARTAMKANRYDKAVVLLKSAIKYDDANPAYHSWYGFALGTLRTHLHEARDACRKALEMEFYSADFHANLGFVYLQAGLKSTADESFAEALKWDPDHRLALKYYGGVAGSPADGAGPLDGIVSFFKKLFSGGGSPKKAPKRKGRPTSRRSG
jgi:curved DNA-binding protein CbpA